MIVVGDEKLGCQATSSTAAVTTATGTAGGGKVLLTRSQKVENLQECVDFLEQRGVDTQNVTAKGLYSQIGSLAWPTLGRVSHLECRIHHGYCVLYLNFSTCQATQPINTQVFIFHFQIKG